MPATGRYTHALISRVPPTFQTLKTIDGSCIDLERARAQQERLVGCLRDLSVDVLELPPDDDSPCSVFINDCAVVLQGNMTDISELLGNAVQAETRNLHFSLFIHFYITLFDFCPPPPPQKK